MEDPNKKNIEEIVSAEDIISEVEIGLEMQDNVDQEYTIEEINAEAKYLAGLNTSKDYQ